MKRLKKNWFWYLLVTVLLFSLFKACNKPAEVETKIEIEYVTKTDTIEKVTIQKVPEKVNVIRYNTIKGKDSIVYVDKETKESIKANVYDTELKSNNTTTKLKITTTGDLLDVKGVTEYKEKQTTITNDVYHNKSGLFMYGEASVQPVIQNIGIGLDYVIKNKYIIGVNASHDIVNNSTSLNLKVGFKL